jgi:hypothetical protein
VSEPPPADATDARVTFNYTDPASREHGEIAVDVRPSGTATTQHASAGPTTFEAPQYQASVAWAASGSGRDPVDTP